MDRRIVGVAALLVGLLLYDRGPVEERVALVHILEDIDKIEVDRMRQQIQDTVVTCVVDREPMNIVMHERSRALAAEYYQPLPRSLFGIGDVVYGMISIDPFAFVDAKGPMVPSQDEEMYQKLGLFNEGQVHNCSFHDMNRTWMTKGFLVHFPNRDMLPETIQEREDHIVVLARILGQVHVWKWSQHHWGDDQHTVVMEILPAFAQLASLRMQYPSYRLRGAS